LALPVPTVLTAPTAILVWMALTDSTEPPELLVQLEPLVQRALLVQLEQQVLLA
jgi:hypothetical protein